MSHPSPESSVITQGSEQPPLTLGPQRLHYQFSVTLPLLHLTLVTILQGLAVTVLWQNIPLPGDVGCPLPGHVVGQAILGCVQVQHFYLPYLASSLLVLIIWMQFVSTTMFLIWPLSTYQTLLIFLLSLGEIIGFTHIHQTAVWLLSLGYIGLMAVWIRSNNVVFAPVLTPDQATQRRQRWVEIMEVLYYLSLSFLLIVHVIGYGAIRQQVLQIIPGLQSAYDDIVFGAIFILLLTVAVWDARRRRVFLQTQIMHTDMVLVNGAARYRERPVQSMPPSHAASESGE